MITDDIKSELENMTTGQRMHLANHLWKHYGTCALKARTQLNISTEDLHNEQWPDPAAFVFTTRLQALVGEFDDKLSTASAIGAFEIVKHELISDALGDEA